jgi:hypothetical protein
VIALLLLLVMVVLLKAITGSFTSKRFNKTLTSYIKTAVTVWTTAT